MHPAVLALENRTSAGYAMVFEDGIDFCQKGLRYLRAHKADKTRQTCHPIDSADLAAVKNDLDLVHYLTIAIENMISRLARTYRQLRHGKPIEILGRSRFWWQNAKFSERERMRGIIEGVVEEFGEFDDQGPATTWAAIQQSR